MNLTKEMLEKRLAVRRAELNAVPEKVGKILEAEYGPNYRLGVARDWSMFDYRDVLKDETDNLATEIYRSNLILEELLECYATD